MNSGDCEVAPAADPADRRSRRGTRCRPPIGAIEATGWRRQAARTRCRGCRPRDGLGKRRPRHAPERLAPRSLRLRRRGRSPEPRPIAMPSRRMGRRPALRASAGRGRHPGVIEGERQVHIADHTAAFSAHVLEPLPRDTEIATEQRDQRLDAKRLDDIRAADGASALELGPRLVHQPEVVEGRGGEQMRLIESQDSA